MVGYRPFLNAGRFPAELWEFAVLPLVWEGFITSSCYGASIFARGQLHLRLLP
jgi:hypothetical protein